MLKKHYKYFGLILLLTFVSCAKRGTITGGLKDTIPPVLKMSFPANYSTNFKGKTIKLTFNEYIKLKNVNKQLIISPPMAKTPEILPQTASKYLTIKFGDTLRSNTTYTLNFGKSIEDNNEGNPLKQFKYVFSTGTFIDSLTLSGKIKDAYDKKAPAFVSVMLYQINSKFKDSVVYKENPRYITNTLDSAKTFKLENLKAGKYMLVALKDENNNNKYNPQKEKIGFRKQYITVPNDSIFEVALFRQISAFQTYKPSQKSGNKLTMGYTGISKDMKIILRNKTEIIPTIITKLEGKDSVQIWIKPLVSDSLHIFVTKDKYKQDFIFKTKKEKVDTLNISSKEKMLPLKEKFTLKSNTPLIKIDNSQIRLINNDSLPVPFLTQYDEWKQELKIDFQKEPSEKYSLKLMKGALTDFMEKQNDTLTFVFETKNTTDYGNLRLHLENVKKFPVIVELTDAKGEIKASAYSEKETLIDFNLLEPSLYTIRVIYDENKNEVWDSGNYLEKKQAEEVIYFSKEVDVRANWDVDQVFNLAP